MNVSHRWLRSVAPGLALDPREVAARLAMRGAPVEGITALAAGLGGVVIGRVEDVRRHPNADRLSLCEVNGGNGPVQVVCGAPNVRAGACYPFAPVGAVLPGGVRIRRVRIRGEESRGMLCSARELGLGTDHEGILELAGEFDPGSEFAPSVGLDDHRLDVEVSPNRGDLLSHVGVARELVGEDGIRLAALPGVAVPGLMARTAPAVVEAEGVRVRVDDPRQCWRYMAAVVRGVRVGPSPEWLASRLRAVGAHPINNVVDATNYVLFELGQPLHAFDLAKIAGPEIVVRAAGQAESVRTLDGERRELDEGMLLVCDPRGPLAIAGVMGGSDSEISAETTDVLLECALFDPKGVRAVRRALGMSTDASYRFERGVDPAGMERALRRAVSIVAATSGGTPAPAMLDACPRPWRAPVVTLRPARVERLLGVRFETGEIVDLLGGLGYRCRRNPDLLEVTVPGHRCYDTLREVDLIEEIARVHGYDSFPDGLGAFRPGAVPDDALLGLHDRIRTALVSRGFLEAHTAAFAPAAEGEVGVLNPVSAEESHLRRTMLFGLLRAAEHNFARGARDIRLFELGTVFGDGGLGAPPDEGSRLGVAMTGLRQPSHWSRKDQPWDEWDLRGLVEDMLRVAVPGGHSIEPGTFDPAFFEEGCEFLLRAADGSVVGGAGRVRPERVDAPVWAGPVWALELDLGDGSRTGPATTFRPLPAFPPVERDLALVVPDALPAGRILDFLVGNGGADLAGVSVFDLFRGGDVPDGQRSIGFRLRYQSGRRTLTDAAVDRALRRLVKRLGEELGVEPRGSAAGSRR